MSDKITTKNKKIKIISDEGNQKIDELDEGATQLIHKEINLREPEVKDPLLKMIKMLLVDQVVKKQIK